MIRTVLIPDNVNVTLSIPKEYIGRELEIIAFTKEEVANKQSFSRKATFDSLAIDTRNYKFDRNEANER